MSCEFMTRVSRVRRISGLTATYLELFHLLDVIAAVLGGRGVREIDRRSLEELSFLNPM